MSAFALRIIIMLVIAIAVFLGARRIWRDWKGQFKRMDEADHQRDLSERRRPDIITLERGKDGKFRPPGDDA